MTAQELAGIYRQRARRVDPEIRGAVRRIGARMLSVSDRLLTAEIYSKPEDVSSTGRPLWRRTNRLAAAEKLELDLNGHQASIVNRVEYAEPRHEANKPGRRRINPARTAHWRDDMVTLLRPEIQAVMGDVNFRLIQGG